MSITVRYAYNNDESAIAALLVKIHQQHAEGRPDLFGRGCAKYTAEEVKAMFHKPEAPLFVACDSEGNVVGYAICQVIENKNPAMGAFSTLYIDDINVSDRVRRQGVGSALLSACREEAKQKGCYNITLNVWAFNEGARRFYEANGFTPQRLILEQLTET
ncbi:MAG: GNAT family N-acetyltransferase [Clostridia bacterium]|nr:GNAT family N-acetyltransferase [Clostridia bacterium]